MTTRARGTFPGAALHRTPSGANAPDAAIRRYPAASASDAEPFRPSVRINPTPAEASLAELAPNSLDAAAAADARGDG